MAATTKIPAVVVGACTHGLAICRSLGRRGIPVHVLESNLGLAGLKTRYAVPTPARNVNGPELIDDLIRTREAMTEDPVLFLTNDNMVRTVAGAFEEISSRYRLNWPSPQTVFTLLGKENLEELAVSAGLRYPRSVMISGGNDLDEVIATLSFPVALKPTQPLSPFKALCVPDRDALVKFVATHQDRVPNFLLQEWVSGTERNIYFSNFYFDGESRPIGKFVGRKIRSAPRNTGGASCAEASDRNDLLDASLKFFEKIPVKGPASLEFKESDDGDPYVIEPTIGRFDFYILCCIRNGVDMPLISYSYQVGGEVVGFKEPRNRAIWMDVATDLPVYLESFTIPGERAAALRFLFRRKVFGLWSGDDMKPSVTSWPRGIRKWTRKVVRIAGKIARRWRWRRKPSAV